MKIRLSHTAGAWLSLAINNHGWGLMQRISGGRINWKPELMHLFHRKKDILGSFILGTASVLYITSSTYIYYRNDSLIFIVRIQSTFILETCLFWGPRTCIFQPQLDATSMIIISTKIFLSHSNLTIEFITDILCMAWCILSIFRRRNSLLLWIWNTVVCAVAKAAIKNVIQM